MLDWQFSPDGETLVYRAEQDDEMQLYAVAFESLPGDFNGDGLVDAADYTTWRDGLGSKYSSDDYAKWKTNFGRGSGGGASGLAAQLAVPEPAGWILLNILLSVIWSLRRKAASPVR